MNRLLISIILSILTLTVSGISFSQNVEARDDPIVIQIVQLDHANAEELARVLQPFLSKDGRITAYGQGNILIIRDRKSIAAQLVKAINGRLTNGD